MAEMQQPSQEQKLYLPLPRALEAGRVDLDALEPHSPHYAGLMIRNGLIPDQAGTFELPRDRVAAYDVVDGEMLDEKFVVQPALTTAVDKESRQIRGGRYIIQTFADEDIFKVIAELAPAQKAEWNKSFARIGTCSLRLFGVDSRIYEFQKPTSQEPITTPIIGRMPRRYF